MLLDASAGGSMMNLSLSGIRELVTSVAENARFREETTRQEEFSRTKNVATVEAPMSSLPEEMKQMKEMMMQLLRRQPTQVRPCEFCGSSDHKTDTCPTLVEDNPEEINAVGGYQGYNNNDQTGPNRTYGQATGQNWVNDSRQDWRNNNNPSRNTYQNAPQPARQFYQPPHRQYNQDGPGQYQQKMPNQGQAGPSQQRPSKPLEEVVKDLSSTMHQFMAKTDGAIAELGKQLSQLATMVSEITNESGRLPSQTIQNPKGAVNMIKASDRQTALEEEAQTAARLAEQQKGPAAYKPTIKHYTRRLRPDWNQEEDRPNDGGTWVTRADNGRYAFAVKMTPPPITHFNVPASGWEIEAQNASHPMKTITSEKHATLKNKVEEEVESRNEQKGLMMNKLITWNHEAKLEMSKDPGAFTVTCGIGKIQVHNCLIDLGASVNVLPYPLYCSLGLGPLKPSRLALELGNKSCVQPAGIVEKLVIRLGKLVVPTDFYVIPVEKTSKDDPPTLILGRPFLHITKAKIDMDKGSLALAFGGKTSGFYLHDNSRTGTGKPPDMVNASDHHTLVSDQSRETKNATRPTSMDRRPSPSQRYIKKKPPEQRSPDPSTSSNKSLGRLTARINARAKGKYNLSRPWDPDPT